MRFGLAAMVRFSVLPPFTRFVWGFSIAVILSLTWPFSLYFVCRECPDGSEYFRELLRNEQTYTTAHHLFFAPAVGLFLASLSGAVIDSVTRRSAFVLLLLTALASLLAYQDTFDGIAGSYQLKSACSFMRRESELRKQSDSANVAFDNDKEAFNSSKTKAGIVNTFKRLNINGFISGILTWLFLVFAAVFIWYSWATAFSPTIVIRQHVQLVVVALLLIAWIPLRVYTDWYQNHWHTKNWINAPVVFGVLIAISMIAFYSVTAIHWYHRSDPLKTMAGIGGAIGAFISFLFAVLPKWAPTVHQWIDLLSPTMVLCFGIVGMLLITALAWIVLASTVDAEHVGEP